MGKEDFSEILLGYVRENYSNRIPEGTELSSETHLFREGIIDSIGVLMLVQFLEERFQLKVEADEMVLDNFASISHMANLISNKQAPGGSSE